MLETTSPSLLVRLSEIDLFGGAVAILGVTMTNAHERLFGDGTEARSQVEWTGASPCNREGARLLAAKGNFLRIHFLKNTIRATCFINLIRMESAVPSHPKTPAAMRLRRSPAPSRCGARPREDGSFSGRARYRSAPPGPRPRDWANDGSLRMKRAEGRNFPPLKSHETRKESREIGTVHARRSSRSAGVTKRTRRAAWGVMFAQCSVEKSSTASPQVGKAPAMRVLSSFGPAAVS